MADHQETLARSRYSAPVLSLQMDDDEGDDSPIMPAPPPPLPAAAAATSSHATHAADAEIAGASRSKLVVVAQPGLLASPGSDITPADESMMTDLSGMAASPATHLPHHHHQQYQNDSDDVSVSSFFGVLDSVRSFFSCLPFGASAATTRRDDFEIPFEAIGDLAWVGGGAQGLVFRGTFRGRTVAVKKYEELTLTMKEMSNLRTLRHRNIVEFLGYSVTPPNFCILMEFCPTSLFSAIHHQNVPPLQVLDWARQIATGMEYLHTMKQVHRDLKSANILIASDGILKITDFGTSRHVNSNPSPMTFAGTAAWMAPELIRNEHCSEKVDVWSFGVVLWELLTGEVPYHGVEEPAIIYGVGIRNLHLPIPTGAPDGFTVLLTLCWNVEPKHRPEFRQILIHLDILASDSLFASIPDKTYYETQTGWRAEIAQRFDELKKQEGHARQKAEDLESELLKAKGVVRLYEERLNKASELLREMTLYEHTLMQRARELEMREKRLADPAATRSPPTGARAAARRRTRPRAATERERRESTGSAGPDDSLSAAAAGAASATAAGLGSGSGSTGTIAASAATGPMSGTRPRKSSASRALRFPRAGSGTRLAELGHRRSRSLDKAMLRLETANPAAAAATTPPGAEDHHHHQDDHVDDSVVLAASTPSLVVHDMSTSGASADVSGSITAASSVAVTPIIRSVSSDAAVMVATQASPSSIDVGVTADQDAVVVGVGGGGDRQALHHPMRAVVGAASADASPPHMPIWDQEHSDAIMSEV